MTLPAVNGQLAKRPAEATGLAGAVVLLVVRVVGISDPDVIVALGIVTSSLPAVVTWIVGLFRRHNKTP